MSSFQSRFCAISISRGLLIFLFVDTAAQHSICLFSNLYSAFVRSMFYTGSRGFPHPQVLFCFMHPFPLSLKESSEMGFPPPSHIIHIHTGGRVFPEVKWRGWVGGWVGVQFNISSRNFNVNSDSMLSSELVSQEAKEGNSSLS